MTWQQHKILICLPSDSAPASEICPEGHIVATHDVYYPTTDPSIPTSAHYEFTVLAFSIVISCYIVARFLGELINFVRRV